MLTPRVYLHNSVTDYVESEFFYSNTNCINKSVTDKEGVRSQSEISEQIPPIDRQQSAYTEFDILEVTSMYVVSRIMKF